MLKSQNMLLGKKKKKKRKEMQTWIHKRGSKRILSITDLNFYYLDVCLYIYLCIYTPKI